jgi:hypothetical protein
VGGWFSGCGDEAGLEAARFGAGLRVGERPVCHPASVSSGLGWPRDGVRWGGVSGLSKLLNQEDALGVPCLDTVIVALRRRALSGHRNAADRRYPLLRSHLRFATPDIRLASADAFAVVGGGCTGTAQGARPNRVVVIKTALTCGS